MSLGLNWVSCRQHRGGSCFCIHSISLYLLVGAFYPFKFKVVIDNVLIGIFLIVLCLCFKSFLFLVFTGYLIPFSICCKTGLMVLNSLNFCLSVKFFIFASNLNEIFAEYTNLGCRFVFSFSPLNTSCHFFLTCRVSAERSSINCMDFPLYVTCCFSLGLLSLLSVSLINICLVFLLGFIL